MNQELQTPDTSTPEQVIAPAEDTCPSVLLDQEVTDQFEASDYPYDTKISRREYEKRKRNFK